MWDAGFGYLAESFWPEANVRRLQEVIRYAAGKGMHVMALGAPFGWSNGALAPDGNLGEASRIIGARFKVDAAGKELHIVNSVAGLRNAGFEEGQSNWFGTRDNGTSVSDVAHSGKRAVSVVDAAANARFRQKIILTPWRQYHVGLWFKSSQFRGMALLEVQDWWHRKQSRFYAEIPAAGSHGWSRLDFTFNSRDTEAAYLYFGVWGGSSGIIWFDDVQLEETGPVYVVRREGAPLRVYDPEDARTEFSEGQDFNRIYDPVLSPPKATFRDVYHPPVRITVPTDSHLRPGQIVAIDFYALFPMPLEQQIGMCLTEPGVFRWIKRNTEALKDILPANEPVLLGYDEMRQGNSCAKCREMNMTAGELLAWNVEKTARLYQTILPAAPLYVWSDMFDPYHNAHDDYFYVEGNLAGSWKGLPQAVGILNWNHTHLRDSLTWFSGLDKRQRVAHSQIIAGYYDSKNPNSARTDLETAGGIPGLQGLMYVTWLDDYSQLEQFAESAKKAWNGYRASAARKNSERRNQEPE